MFKFHTGTQPASKIRVILRKLSVQGFEAVLTVYDADEKEITSGIKQGDTPVPLGFESNPNSDYYIAVKPFWNDGRGDYELTVPVKE